MKRAVIVHCWGGSPDYAWYPSVKKQLEGRGYQVTVPAMPDTDNPKLKSWLPHLQKVIGQPDEELLLIGHSVGTVTIMRYLESLPENTHVSKVILVAAFTGAIGWQELENFFERPLAFDKIKTKSRGGFVLIQSDNDPYVPNEHGEQLKEALDAKLVVVHEAGHMSGEENCVELPEVIESL